MAGKKKKKENDFFFTKVLPIIVVILELFYFLFQEVIIHQVERLGDKLYVLKVFQILSSLLLLSLIISFVFQLIGHMKNKEKEKKWLFITAFFTIITLIIFIILTVKISQINNVSQPQIDDQVPTGASTPEMKGEVAELSPERITTEELEITIPVPTTSLDSTMTADDTQEDVQSIPEISLETEDEIGSFFPEWNFKNATGCILSEWAYWPISAWHEKFEGNLLNACDNYLDLGFEVIQDEGLSIIFFEPDGNIEFGISREVPENIRKIKIKLSWINVERGDGDIIFMIGFVDTTSPTLEGQYFYLQRNPDTFSPHVYITGQVSTEEKKYLGYSNIKGDREIIIDCDLLTSKKMKCTYTWDDQEEIFIQYFQKGWDSIYFGYKITTNGIMDVLIEEVDLQE
ncbi:MAG: hypothetical protein H0S79_20115 [Anaerolineaceae bacterium]|nr:hypothetical protein [Anaerolineaceae bacterium]